MSLISLNSVLPVLFGPLRIPEFPPTELGVSRVIDSNLRHPPNVLLQLLSEIGEKEALASSVQFRPSRPLCDKLDRGC